MERSGELPEDVLSAELIPVPGTVGADVPIGTPAKSIPTEPINLSTIATDKTLSARLVPPEQITLIGSPEIQVKIAVQKKSSSEE